MDEAEKLAKDEAQPLVNAAADCTNAVLPLLAGGANINGRSNRTFGWTPLISAIYHHKREVAGLLIAYGADLNISDAAGDTPLFWTIRVWADNTNLIQQLVSSGANPLIRNRDGSDAFDIAHSRPNPEEILPILRTYRHRDNAAPHGGTR